MTTPKSNLVLDRDTHTIRITRDFTASSAQIFDAWTRPEHVTSWWDPDGAPLAVCDIDLTVGGVFNFVTRAHPEHPFVGTYREIAPPNRLVFETMGAMGRVLLQELSGLTHMTVEIQCGSAEQLAQFLQWGIHEGTAQTLDNLVAYAQRWR